MFLQGHIRCQTEGLAQAEVHRIRLAIPKFLLAAQALTLLGHDKINELIWFNQVKSDKWGETMTRAKGWVPKIKVRCGSWNTQGFTRSTSGIDFERATDNEIDHLIWVHQVKLWAQL